MDEESKKYYENKRVKVTLHNGDFYSGVVLEEHKTHIVLKDKFGDRVHLSFEVISILRVVENVEKIIKRGAS